MQYAAIRVEGGGDHNAMIHPQIYHRFKRGKSPFLFHWGALRYFFGLF